jgi:ketosteroid isomerase-like protein
VSQANVDLVRSIFAGWERGDFSSSDWAHADIEYVIADEPGSETRIGVTAMAEAWREFLRSWQEYRVEADEYRRIDEERVLVLLKVFGRGKTSGLDLGTVASERRGANVFHVRDGKVTRLATYFDKQRALADLGLTE